MTTTSDELPALKLLTDRKASIAVIKGRRLLRACLGDDGGIKVVVVHRDDGTVSVRVQAGAFE